MVHVAITESTFNLGHTRAHGPGASLNHFLMPDAARFVGLAHAVVPAIAIVPFLAKLIPSRRSAGACLRRGGGHGNRQRRRGWERSLQRSTSTAAHARSYRLGGKSVPFWRNDGRSDRSSRRSR